MTFSDVKRAIRIMFVAKPHGNQTFHVAVHCQLWWYFPGVLFRFLVASRNESVLKQVKLALKAASLRDRKAIVVHSARDE